MAAQIVDRIGPYTIKKYTHYNGSNFSHWAGVRYGILLTESGTFLFQCDTLSEARSMCQRRVAEQRKRSA